MGFDCLCLYQLVQAYTQTVVLLYGHIRPQCSWWGLVFITEACQFSEEGRTWYSDNYLTSKVKKCGCKLNERLDEVAVGTMGMYDFWQSWRSLAAKMASFVNWRPGTLASLCDKFSCLNPLLTHDNMTSCPPSSGIITLYCSCYNGAARWGRSPIPPHWSETCF